MCASSLCFPHKATKVHGALYPFYPLTGSSSFGTYKLILYCLNIIIYMCIIYTSGLRKEVTKSYEY